MWKVSPKQCDSTTRSTFWQNKVLIPIDWINPKVSVSASIATIVNSKYHISKLTILQKENCALNEKDDATKFM